SGAIGPAMREMAPLIGKLAQVLTSVFVPNLLLLSSVFRLLAPVIEVVTDALQVFEDVMRVVTAITTALIDALRASGFLTFMKGVQEGFLNILKELIKGVILFGAAVAKFLGIPLAGFIADLKKGGDQAKEMNAAPQSAAIQTWDQIRQAVTTSAFIASGEAGKKTTDEFLAGILTQLEKIEGGQMGVKDTLKGAFDAVAGAIAQMAKDLIDKGIEEATKAIRGLPKALHIPGA